jgi:hypothetical protein
MHSLFNDLQNRSLKELDQLMKNILMEPMEIYSTREIREILSMNTVRIELLQKEIVAALNGHPPQGYIDCMRTARLCAHPRTPIRAYHVLTSSTNCSISALVIIEQPNPQIVFKTKDIHN